MADNDQPFNMVYGQQQCSGPEEIVQHQPCTSESSGLLVSTLMPSHMSSACSTNLIPSYTVVTATDSMALPTSSSQQNVILNNATTNETAPCFTSQPAAENGKQFVTVNAETKEPATVINPCMAENSTQQYYWEKASTAVKEEPSSEPLSELTPAKFIKSEETYIKSEQKSPIVSSDSTQYHESLPGDSFLLGSLHNFEGGIEPAPGKVYIDTALDPTLGHITPIGSLQLLPPGDSRCDNHMLQSKTVGKQTARKSTGSRMVPSKKVLQPTKRRGRPPKNKAQDPGPKEKANPQPVAKPGRKFKSCRKSEMKLINLFVRNNRVSIKGKAQLTARKPVVPLKRFRGDLKSRYRECENTAVVVSTITSQETKDTNSNNDRIKIEAKDADLVDMNQHFGPTKELNHEAEDQLSVSIRNSLKQEDEETVSVAQNNAQTSGDSKCSTVADVVAHPKASEQFGVDSDVIGNTDNIATYEDTNSNNVYPVSDETKEVNGDSAAQSDNEEIKLASAATTLVVKESGKSDMLSCSREEAELKFECENEYDVVNPKAENTIHGEYQNVHLPRSRSVSTEANEIKSVTDNNCHDVSKKGNKTSPSSSRVSFEIDSMDESDNQVNKVKAKSDKYDRTTGQEPNSSYRRRTATKGKNYAELSDLSDDTETSTTTTTIAVGSAGDRTHLTIANSARSSQSGRGHKQAGSRGRGRPPGSGRKRSNTKLPDRSQIFYTGKPPSSEHCQTSEEYDVKRQSLASESMKDASVSGGDTCQRNSDQTCIGSQVKSVTEISYSSENYTTQNSCSDLDRGKKTIAEQGDTNEKNTMITAHTVISSEISLSGTPHDVIVEAAEIVEREKSDNTLDSGTEMDNEMGKSNDCHVMKASNNNPNTNREKTLIDQANETVDDENITADVESGQADHMLDEADNIKTIIDQHDLSSHRRRSSLKVKNYAEFSEVSDEENVTDAYSSSDDWEEDAGLKKHKSKTTPNKKVKKLRLSKSPSTPGKRGRKRLSNSFIGGDGKLTDNHTDPTLPPLISTSPPVRTDTLESIAQLRPTSDVPSLATIDKGINLLAMNLMPNVNSSSFPCKMITNNPLSKKCARGQKKTKAGLEPSLPCVLKTVGEKPDEQTSVYQCPICPHTVESTDDAGRHIKEAHSKEIHFAMYEEPKQQPIPYIGCRHCDFIALNQLALWNHFADYHNISGNCLPIKDKSTV